jgi:hypothetical protein
MAKQHVVIINSVTPGGQITKFWPKRRSNITIVSLIIIVIIKIDTNYIFYKPWDHLFKNIYQTAGGNTI